MKKKITLLVVALCCYFTNYAQFNVTQVDPGETGSFQTTVIDYIDQDIILPSLPGRDIKVEAIGHMPVGDGPFPIVIVLHGRHNTCYVIENTAGFLELPCGTDNSTLEIPNHEGYFYLTEFLASHGYIAVSLYSNDVLRSVQLDTPTDKGAQARAELIQHHLGLWKTFNETSETNFNGDLINKIDLNNIVTVGHSRGGEGVVKHFLHNESLGSPYTIKGVFSIAPTNDNNFIAPGMNYAVAVPYCDGDVPSLPGTWAYDRQAEVSNAGTHQILLMGANHNYFNTVWSPGGFVAGTSDDWASLTRNTTNKGSFCGNGSNRFGQAKQRNVLKAFVNSFIKTYVDENLSYAEPIFGINPIAPSTTQLGSREIHVSYNAPSVDRAELHTVKNLLSTTNTSSGGTFTTNNLTNFGVCGSADQNFTCVSADLDDHRSTNLFDVFQTGLARLLVSWSSTGAYFEQTVPSNLENAEAFSHFTFRAGVTGHPPFNINRGTTKDFTIEITDSDNNSASTNASQYSTQLFSPPGNYGTTTPHNVAGTIAVPLTAFAGINLSKVQKIKFIFDKSPMGEYYFTDFAFTKYGAASEAVFSIFDIAKVENNTRIKVYPNPTTDFVSVVSENFKVTAIAIYNLDGSLLINKEDRNGINAAISVESLASGLYYIKINNSYSKKLVKY